MPQRPRPSPPAASPPRDLLDWPAGWSCALIFFVAFIAYWPALAGGFLWDDDGHVTKAGLRSLGGLWRIWAEPGATQQYYPLLHSAFWLEHLLWGDAPVGYHLLNILLHVSAACLLAVTLRRLALPGAWLAGLLFALHPVCVESVAWISEQKNTLSTVIYLCAALAYLRFDESRRPGAYLLATVLFVAALGTKTVTATLPAALLVVFWWRRGCLAWRDVAPLLPWFALGAVAGFVTARVERTLIGAEGADFALGAVQRCLLAGRVVWFYLGKLLWPSDLVFFYPRWDVDASEPWQYLFPLGLAAALAGLAWRARRARGPLAAALFFTGSLFPALGFINVFPFLFSFVADHFQYLACMGVFAAAAAGLMALSALLPRGIGCVAIAGLLVTLGCLTSRQSRIYHDGFSLYESTLARNPDSWIAHNNLGNLLVESGRADEAIAHFETALRLRPDHAPSESNLGDQLTRLGRANEAIPHLQRAIQLAPAYPEAHNNLGLALLAANRAPEAVAQFQEALRYRPDYAQAEMNLGLALCSSNRVAEGIPHFQRALQLKPDYADAHINWGGALVVSGRLPEALGHFQEAIRVDPGNSDAHFKLGRALAFAGRSGDALAAYRKAVELNPGYADAQLALALALQQAGQQAEAQEHYTEAVRLNPALARRP
ncbi:MAG TPA: tetratricopeptide repeat protein [Opitutaceae bacterium]|nr:tetratricopeptide repeat protein [Opitutaceae bacterium]